MWQVIDLNTFVTVETEWSLNIIFHSCEYNYVSLECINYLFSPVWVYFWAITLLRYVNTCYMYHRCTTVSHEHECAFRLNALLHTSRTTVSHQCDCICVSLDSSTAWMLCYIGHRRKDSHQRECVSVYLQCSDNWMFCCICHQCGVSPVWVHFVYV